MILLLALVTLLSGCAASVISESVLMGVDRTTTLPMVQSDPEAYKEQKVLWGGTIVSIKNLPDHTRIEVLAKELAYMDEPLAYGNYSQGRFIILAPGYIDKLNYKPGTGITVAGIVKGTEKIKIGELDYPYVLIVPIEMKTFESYDDLYRNKYPYSRNYPYYGPYGPYPPNPYDPFFDPYFGPYYGPYYPGLPPYYYPPGYYPSGHPRHRRHK